MDAAVKAQPTPVAAASDKGVAVAGKGAAAAIARLNRILKERRHAIQIRRRSQTA
jgi:hypothetical protein